MRPKKSLTTANTIGCEIRKNRKKCDSNLQNVAAIASKLGVSKQTWYKWEAGEVVPSDSYQQKLAEFFHVSVAELRGESIKSKPPASAGGLSREDMAFTVLCLDIQRVISKLALDYVTVEDVEERQDTRRRLEQVLKSFLNRAQDVG